MHKIFFIISYLLISNFLPFSSLQASKNYLEDEAEQEEVYPQQSRKRSRSDERASFLRAEKESIEFVSRSVLLHLTPIFPRNGIMRAGAMIQDKPIPSEQAMPSRSTIHFSWNGFSEYSMTREKLEKLHLRPYCIIERLDAVQDQLYGGNPSDVMVVGDHILSENSSIIVPRREYYELKLNNPRFKGEIILYESWETAKNKAHELMERKYKVPNVEVLSNPLSGDWKVRIRPSNLPCPEVDAELMLRPFFKGKYWGTHEDSPLGIIDSILTYLNHPFVFMCLRDYELANHILSPEEIKRALILYEYHRGKLLDRQEGLSDTMFDFLRNLDRQLEG